MNNTGEYFKLSSVRRTTVICISIILFIFVFFHQGCALLKKSFAIYDCIFRIANVESIDYNPLLSPDRFGITINVDCKNPNKTTEAVLNKLTFNLYVNEQELGAGNMANKLKIPPDATVQFPVNVNLSLSRVEKVLFDIINSGAAVYKLKGTAFISTPIGEMSIPVTISEGRWSGE